MKQKYSENKINNEFRLNFKFPPVYLQGTVVSQFKPAEKKPWRTVPKRDILIFTLVAAVLFVCFQGARLVAQGVNTKAYVLGAATGALAHLKEAESLVQQKNFTDSEQQFLLAEQNFTQAKENLHQLGNVVNSLLQLSNLGKSANSLLDAGQALSLAGANYNNFYSVVSKIKISAQGFNTPDGFYETINAAKGYLQAGNDLVARANKDLKNVDLKSLPADYQDKYNQYAGLLDSSIGALSQTYNLIDVLQSFIGQGKKTVLVLFENNNELRATGGFIGTYGIFQLNDGKIENQKITSIYDLDGQLQNKVAPPGPFHDLTDRWGLRDSNWFVDYQQSAEKAAAFYEQEGYETPDAVIAVTPDVFTDLLGVTGPVDFPKYGLTLTAENFRDQIQLNTSMLYDKTVNTPKQMLADFAPLLLQNLNQADTNKKIKLITALFKDIQQKNILFYDRDPNIESKFQALNWAGKILPTNKDYLAIYNTNLGGKKTDINISQSVQLQSNVQSDGSIINTLTYTRSRTQDLANTQDVNNDYVRVLVPQGSQFISADGFIKKQYYRSDGSGYAGQNSASPVPYQIDPDLQFMDANSTVDGQTGTIITTEAGKTEFANWIDTAPGETSIVTLKYKLPFLISDSHSYSLLIQRQPGNNPIDISYSIKPGRKILWYTPYGLETDPNGGINYKQQLNADLFLGLVLE